MQKYFLIICLLIDFAVWGQPFRLSMDFRNLGINDTLILSQKNREKYVAIGKYYAGAKKKIIKFKNPAFLSLNINNYKFYKEFIVDSVVTVYFDKSKDSLFVSSSSENRQLQYINDHFTAPFRADLISLNKQKSTFINLKDTAKVDSIELKQSLLMDRLVNDYKNYIYQNRNSYTSIGLINWGYNKFDIYEVEKMLNILNKNLQNNSVVLYLRQRLKIDLSISEGKNIHYFSIIDARGDTFSSTQLEKGIFILCFLGIYMPPFIKASPLLLKTKGKYHTIKG